MANFDIAVKNLLKEEGGYSNRENDRGGETKFGITQKFLNLIQDKRFPVMVKDLSIDDASLIYKDHFWDKYRLYEIIHQHLANYVLEIIVNLQPAPAGKIIQRGINLTARNLFSSYDDMIKNQVNIDGIIGTRTRQMLNKLPAQELIKNIKSYLISHYQAIVKSNPSQQENLNGWLNRAAS